jgi:hypothetical protein
MNSLGFDKGYLAQGCDVGIMIDRELSLSYDSCKGVHNSTASDSERVADAAINRKNPS